MRVIALEEHYWDEEVASHFKGRNSSRSGDLLERLYDVDELRIREMDEAGVDVQVLSHGAPSTQRMEPQTAVAVAARANDRLHETVRARPDRFAGFAALPTPAPEAAADELERTVRELGFKGGMIHGLTNGEFIDHRKYWPIFERAQALDVPIYIHPGYPHPDVLAAYYQDYLKEYPTFASAGWGYTVETATQGIRMVLSGMFDEYPDLKIILGHLGEALPFSLWRIDQALSRKENTGGKSFRETFCKHFYITTSGNFSNTALLCCVMEMGVDRIMFSIDYPFVENKPGVDWTETIPLCGEDKVKILSGNVERLLRL
jgi:2,3-dihydroxybenzoate decarboxylase